MHKKLFILVIAVISLFSMPLSVHAEPKKMTIVFSGDMRGELENCHCPKDDFGGIPRRAKYIDEVRSNAREDILLVDVGDVLALATSEDSKRDISYSALVSFKAMKLMGYAVMNVGESDLILGEEYLKQKESVSSFPFISANIVDKGTGKPFFKPYFVKTMENGLRVGIIGLVNERYIINSDQLEILPHKQAIERYISELGAKSDIVIVLGHLGLPYSEELANYVEGIDIILSGHWDVDTQEPIKVGDTVIMPTTYNSRKIGRLDIEVENGIVSSYKWESTPLGKEYDGNELLEKLISKRPDFEKKPNVDEAPAPLPVENLAVNGDPLKVFVFYSHGCRSCMEVEKEVLPKIIEKYSNDISIQHLDISVAENYEQMIRFEKLYNVQGGGYVPEVIVSRYVLMGKKDIESNLDSVIEKSLNENVKKKTISP